VVNNSGSGDLWLSATGAVVNGGRWLRTFERGPGNFVPHVIAMRLSADEELSCAFTAPLVEAEDAKTGSH
jgi:hypothetical protein